MSDEEKAFYSAYEYLLNAITEMSELLMTKQDSVFFSLQRRIFLMLDRINTLIASTSKATLEKYNLDIVITNLVDVKFQMLLSEPIRKQLATLLLSLYTNLDDRFVFDSISSYLTKTSIKTSLNVRLASYLIITKIFRSFGNRYGRLFPDIFNNFVRGITKSNVTSERLLCLKSLQNIINSIDKVIVITQGVEIYKLLTKMIVDKSDEIRLVSYSFLVDFANLITSSPADAEINNLGGYEGLLELAIKGLEEDVVDVMQVASQAVGLILALGVTNEVNLGKTKSGLLGKLDFSKAKKTANAISKLDFSSSLRILFGLFEQAVKTNALLGITKAFVSLINQLNNSYLSDAKIIDSINTLLSLVRNTDLKFENEDERRSDSQLRFACVSYIIRNGISLNSGQGRQIAIARSLSYLIKEELLAGDRFIELEIILVELKFLLDILNDSSIGFIDELSDPLLECLSCSNFNIRLHAALLLSSVVKINPKMLTVHIQTCLDIITAYHAQLKTAGSLIIPEIIISAQHSLYGHAIALMIILLFSINDDVFVPELLIESIREISIKLIYTAVDVIKKMQEDDDDGDDGGEVAQSLIMDGVVCAIRSGWCIFSCLSRTNPAKTKLNLDFIFDLYDNCVNIQYILIKSNSDQLKVELWTLISSMTSFQMFLKLNYNFFYTVDCFTERVIYFLSNVLMRLSALSPVCISPLSAYLLLLSKTTLLSIFNSLPDVSKFSSIHNVLLTIASGYMNDDRLRETSLLVSLVSSEDSPLGLLRGDNFTFDLLNVDNIPKDVVDHFTWCRPLSKVPLLNDWEQINSIIESTYISTYKKLDITNKTIPLDIPLSNQTYQRSVDVAITTFSHLIPHQTSSNLGNFIDKILASIEQGVALDKSQGGKKESMDRTREKLTYNVLCVMLGSLRSLQCSKRDIDPHPWMHKSREFLFSLLLNPNVSLTIRRAISEAIGYLSSIAGPDFVRGVVRKTQEDVSKSQQIKASLLFTLACMQRCIFNNENNESNESTNAVIRDEIFKVVTESVPPLKSWVLHSWFLVISENGNSIFKNKVNNEIMERTLNIVIGHLLGDNGNIYESNFSRVSVNLILLENINLMLNYYNKELSSYKCSKLVSNVLAIWHLFYKENNFAVVKELLKTLDHILLYFPQAIPVKESLNFIKTTEKYIDEHPSICEYSISLVGRMIKDNVSAIKEESLDLFLFKIFDKLKSVSTSISESSLSKTLTDVVIDMSHLDANHGRGILFWVDRCKSIIKGDENDDDGKSFSTKKDGKARVVVNKTIDQEFKLIDTGSKVDNLLSVGWRLQTKCLAFDVCINLINDITDASLEIISPLLNGLMSIACYHEAIEGREIYSLSQKAILLLTKLLQNFAKFQDDKGETIFKVYEKAILSSLKRGIEICSTSSSSFPSFLSLQLASTILLNNITMEDAEIKRICLFLFNSKEYESNKNTYFSKSRLAVLAKLHLFTKGEGFGSEITKTTITTLIHSQLLTNLKSGWIKSIIIYLTESNNDEFFPVLLCAISSLPSLTFNEIPISCKITDMILGSSLQFFSYNKDKDNMAYMLLSIRYLFTNSSYNIDSFPIEGGFNILLKILLEITTDWKRGKINDSKGIIDENFSLQVCLLLCTFFQGPAFMYTQAILKGDDDENDAYFSMIMELISRIINTLKTNLSNRTLNVGRSFIGMNEIIKLLPLLASCSKSGNINVFLPKILQLQMKVLSTCLEISSLPSSIEQVITIGDSNIHGGDSYSTWNILKRSLFYEITSKTKEQNFYLSTVQWSILPLFFNKAINSANVTSQDVNNVGNIMMSLLHFFLKEGVDNDKIQAINSLVTLLKTNQKYGMEYFTELSGELILLITRNKNVGIDCKSCGLQLLMAVFELNKASVKAQSTMGELIIATCLGLFRGSSPQLSQLGCQMLLQLMTTSPTLFKTILTSLDNESIQLEIQSVLKTAIELKNKHEKDLARKDSGIKK